jgi:type I restriction enzyme, S subunit
MSAVMEIREASATYLSDLQPQLVQHFELMATAPGGVGQLRELILTLAIQGKLMPQEEEDEAASELLKRIQIEKDRLIAEGKVKRDKPLSAMKVARPFALPVGWEWVRALDVCALITDGDHQPPPKAESGVPFLVIGDVRTGAVALHGASRFVPESYFEELDWGKKPSLGDVLYTTVGSFGIPVPVIEEQRFCFQRHIALFRPAMVNLQSFLALSLRTNFAFRQAEKGATGIAQKTVPLSALRELMLPLPPLAEQSRIVTRVEELMRLCDALESKAQLEAAQHAQLVQTLLGALTASATPDELADNWQRVATHFDLLLDRPEAIDALEQTILQLAVRGLLVPQDPKDEPGSVLLQKIRTEKDRLIAEGKIKRDKPLPALEEEVTLDLPNGWERTRFGDYFFELCTGPFGSVIHKEDYIEGGVPLINPSHMIGGRVLHDPSISVSREMAESLGAYRLSAGDILLARRGEVGRYALVTKAEEGWLCGTGSFFVKADTSCNRRFLGLVFEDPSLRRHLLGESVGATMTNLNQRILLETTIVLPPLAEQARIVARVESLRCLCADLRQRLAARQTTQSHLAESLVESAAA